MDKAALGLAMEHEMKIIVFDLVKENNIKNIFKHINFNSIHAIQYIS